MYDFKVKGVVPPVVTPDKPDHTLDVVSFERLLNHLIDSGVHGLFLLGSTGEVAFSNDAHRDEIVREGMRIVDGRVPVLVGCIDTETDRVIEHAKRAKVFGADAIVATAPFYALGGLAEVEEHFRILHEEIDLPIFAYDIPVCVHTKLPWELTLKLGKEGVICGVKDSSGDDVNFRYLVQENKAAGRPLSLLTGHEIVVDGAYLSGADGSVPGLGNVIPELYVQQYLAYCAGEWEKVRTLQDHINEVSKIMRCPQGIQGYGRGVGSFKTALNLMGIIDHATMPRPVKELEGENREAVRKVLLSCGVLKG